VSQSVASVTVAYNGAGVLQRHVEALLGQVRPLQEIVVVDNGSGDGTCSLIAERYPQVTATAHPKQGGEIGARRGGGVRVERIHPVHERHLATRARSRDPGDEGQEQAAASGGSGTDDLAEPTRRK